VFLVAQVERWVVYDMVAVRDWSRCFGLWFGFS
jgi:hypothetical protein